jgi:transposase
MQIKMPPKNELNNFLINHNNIEASQYWSVSSGTIQKWRRNYGLNNKEVKYGHFPKTLTKNQTQIMTGNMLGDGYTSLGRKSKNAYFNFKQQIKNIKYVEFIYSNLQPFSRKIIKTNNIRNDKIHKSCQFATISSEVFTKLHSKWYRTENNKKTKIIPKDIYLTWKTVAFWYADDGNNNIPKKSITLSTNGFSKNDILFLIDKLRQDLDIIASINKQREHYTIRISSKFYFLFIKKVKKYLNIFDCFSHKLNTLNAGKENLTKYSCKSVKSITAVIDAYNKGQQIAFIAKKFNVNKSTINRIIRSPNTNPDYKPTSRKKINPTIVLHILDLWNSGKNQVEISKLTNTSQSLVGMIVRRKIWCNITKDIQIRKSRANRKPPLKELLEYDIKLAALRYGVQTQTARNWFKSYGY